MRGRNRNTKEFFRWPQTTEEEICFVPEIRVLVLDVAPNSFSHSYTEIVDRGS